MIYSGRSYDKEYIELCKRVLSEGVKDTNPRPKYADGSKAYSYGVFQHEIRISHDVVPLLFSKKVGVKHAIEEMLWIWRDRSNVVKDLQDKNIHIWDEWEREDGTIGKCYGYQLARKVDDSGLNQVDNLIKGLKEDPESRRHITTLWDISSGHEMALKPCVYETQWVVLGGRLNLKVLVRSNDIALGNPYNLIQYWVLHRLIAKEVGLGVGELVFSISIPHIYDRHVSTIKEQIQRYELLSLKEDDNKQITIDLGDKDFYNFSSKDVIINGYDSYGNEPLKVFKYEVAI